MVTTKVGIREFRAGLADYIASDHPVAVTRHGRTVGFFIPTRTDLAAEIAALRSAAAQLDEMLVLDDSEIDELVKDYKEVRRGAGH
jgi:antitoxin (DNA-binding transcriptional repressor) of toxin-antitoxin stability system